MLKSKYANTIFAKLFSISSFPAVAERSRSMDSETSSPMTILFLLTGLFSTGSTSIKAAFLTVRISGF